MGFLPVTGELCADIVRDGATQAGIVDIDVERVSIVDGAELVIDAGNGLREAVIELGLRVCRGGLVLVFQPEGGHVGVGPTGDSGVEGLLVVLQGRRFPRIPNTRLYCVLPLIFGRKI